VPDAVLLTLRSEFSDLPDLAQATRILVRLLMAALLGGVLGYERERHGKAAGVRTHMLVAMGAALFVLVPQQGGMDVADMSRVIQGIVTGVGFPGPVNATELTAPGCIRDAPLGAARHSGYSPEQGLQRRGAPEDTPARRVSTQNGRTRRSEALMGERPHLRLRA
jgi:hypothetical protein